MVAWALIRPLRNCRCSGFAPGPFYYNVDSVGGAERVIPQISEHHIGQPLLYVQMCAAKGISVPH